MYSFSSCEPVPLVRLLYVKVLYSSILTIRLSVYILSLLYNCLGMTIPCRSAYKAQQKVWRSGRVLECKSEDIGSCPGDDVTFQTIHFYRRSSTFEKFCRKSSIFIVKFSSGISKNFFDTCVNWSCVTRCGCRTTSSTLFTVKGDPSDRTGASGIYDGSAP